MSRVRTCKFLIPLIIAAIPLMPGEASRLAHSQDSTRVAQIPGIKPGPCNPGPEERPWLNPNQLPGCRALEVIAGMSLEEKLAELGGITGRSANKRLGLIAGGGSDGPNGIATMGSNPQPRGMNVTAFANAVTLVATWNRGLASQYGKALGEEFVGKGSNSAGYLIQFMKTGNPNAKGLLTWPKYTSIKGETMIVDHVCEVKDDPDGEARKSVTTT